MYVRSETKYNRKRDHHDKGKFKLCSHQREETDRREREKGKERRIVRAKEAANVRVREEERDRPERRGQSERQAFDTRVVGRRGGGFEWPILAWAWTVTR